MKRRESISDANQASARDMILSTARSLFFSRGFDQTEMDDIAREAHVPAAVVRENFGSQLAIIRGLIERRFDEFLEQMASCISEDDIELSLSEMLYHCARLATDPDVLRFERFIMYELRANPQVAATFCTEAIGRVPVALTAYISWRAERGDLQLDEPKVASEMLLGMMMYGSGLVWPGDRNTAEDGVLKERARACAKLFLQGCAIRLD